MKKFFAVGCAILFATITIACSPDETTTPKDDEAMTQEARDVGISINVTESVEQSAQEVGVSISVGEEE
jgi:hypothetical protein